MMQRLASSNCLSLERLMLLISRCIIAQPHYLGRFSLSVQTFVLPPPDPPDHILLSVDHFVLKTSDLTSYEEGEKEEMGCKESIVVTIILFFLLQASITIILMRFFERDSDVVK